MFRSALLILSGNATASVLLLARNLIVARLIPVADFGIASTFAITMAVVEMMSALGLQQQIVQAKNGNDPHLQAALQGFQVLRGVISGAVLFAIAGPVAGFLGIPQVAWAYQLLALVPVMNALVHFDVYRMNRTMTYLPGILTVAVPALVSVLAVWPLAMIWGDWRVMLYAILAQSVVTVITSHLVAERRYRLVLDRAVMAGSLRFGWPLLVNGVLLFAVYNGEKLIVGRELGMEALAIFSMGFTLTLAPMLVMATSAQKFFLPQLSAVMKATIDHDRHFAYLSMATFQLYLLFGTLLALGTVLIGPQVVHILLGPRYEALVPILTLLAILQALRVFKGGPSTVALARAHTENAMVANILRVALLPIAWLVVAGGDGMTLVIWLGILGEALGAAVAFGLVRWRLGLHLRALAWPMILSLATLGAAGLYAWQQEHPGALPFGSGWTVAMTAMLFGLSLIGMTDLRRYVLRREVSHRDH